MDWLFDPGDRIRHRKGGFYVVVARGCNEPDKAPVYVYRSEADGTIWVRDKALMEDGRFILDAPGGDKMEALERSWRRLWASLCDIGIAVGLDVTSPAGLGADMATQDDGGASIVEAVRKMAEEVGRLKFVDRDNGRIRAALLQANQKWAKAVEKIAHMKRSASGNDRALRAQLAAALAHRDQEATKLRTEVERLRTVLDASDDALRIEVRVAWHMHADALTEAGEWRRRAVEGFRTLRARAERAESVSAEVRNDVLALLQIARISRIAHNNRYPITERAWKASTEALSRLDEALQKVDLDAIAARFAPPPEAGNEHG